VLTVLCSLVVLCEKLNSLVSRFCASVALRAQWTGPECQRVRWSSPRSAPSARASAAHCQAAHLRGAGGR
jgi:hypothetical protein